MSFASSVRRGLVASSVRGDPVFLRRAQDTGVSAALTLTSVRGELVEPDKMKAESFRRLLAHLDTLADALVSAAQNADRFQSSVKVANDESRA